MRKMGLRIGRAKATTGYLPVTCDRRWIGSFHVALLISKGVLLSN